MRLFLVRSILCATLIGLILVNKSKAQSPATGCLISDNRVYYNDWGGGGITPYYWYDTAVYNTLPANTCRWTATSTTRSCSTCSGFSQNSSGVFYCSGSQQIGVYATYTATAIGCPIDDHIYLLLHPLGICGFYFIRKRNFNSLLV